MSRILRFVLLLVAAYGALVLAAVLAFEAARTPPPAHGQPTRVQRIEQLQHHDPSAIVLLGPSDSP